MSGEEPIPLWAKIVAAVVIVLFGVPLLLALVALVWRFALWALRGAFG